MLHNENKLLFIATFTFFLSISVGFEALASTMQEPKWARVGEWEEPPLFKMKRSFFAEPSSIAKPGDINNGLLRCRVLVRDDLKLDTGLFSSPEIFFKLNIADHKQMTLSGRGGGYSKWFYAKLDELRVNQTIRIHVEEEDYFSDNEVVGDITLRYRGQRVFGAETAYIEVRCMVLNSTMLKQEEDHQLHMFHQDIKETTAWLLKNPTETFRERSFHVRILGLAALSGWNSLAVQEALKGYTKLMNISLNIKRDIMRDINQQILAENRPDTGLPVPLPNSTLEVFVKGIECGKETWNKYQSEVSFQVKKLFKKNRCILKIGVKNKGPEALLDSSTTAPYSFFEGVSIINEDAETIGLVSFGFVVTKGTPAVTRKVKLKKNTETTILFIPKQHIAEGVVVNLEGRFGHPLRLNTKTKNSPL